MTYELKEGDILFGEVYVPKEFDDDEDDIFAEPEPTKNPFRVWKDLSHMSPERQREKAREMKREANKWDLDHLKQKTEAIMKSQERLLAMSDEEYMIWYHERVRKQNLKKKKEKENQVPSELRFLLED